MAKSPTEKRLSVTFQLPDHSVQQRVEHRASDDLSRRGSSKSLSLACDEGNYRHEVLQLVKEDVSAAKAYHKDRKAHYSKLGATFPLWLIVANCLFACCLGLLYLSGHAPTFIEVGSDDCGRYCKPEKWGAYLTMMGMFSSLTLICNGVPDHLVFGLLATLLLVTKRVNLVTALLGFDRFGPWVPQLQAIIIKSVRESGLLEEILGTLLGKQQANSRLAGVKLYFSSLLLGAIIGGGPTVVTATPVVVRWAECYKFRPRPLLYVLVVAAACGNVMLLTSAPASVAIKEIMCDYSRRCPLQVYSPAPLALIIAIILGGYAALVGRHLSELDRALPLQARARPRKRSGLNEWGVEMSSEDSHREATLLEEGHHRQSGAPAEEQSQEASASADGRQRHTEADAMSVAESEFRGSEIMVWGNANDPVGGGDVQLCPLRAHLTSMRLYYEVDFVLLEGSLLCGHTPRSAGMLREEDGVAVIQDGIFFMAISRAGSGTQSDAAPGSSSFSCDETSRIADWCFQAGDLINARCSAQGIVAMRQRPKVFVMHGLACHHLLGGRRHERRLFEGVLASGSRFTGRTLEEILGIGQIAPGQYSELEASEGRSLANAPEFVKMFRGYPISAWRREGDEVASIRPLSSRGDRLASGDVILIDAFEEFPSLPQTTRHFVMTSLVPNSQAPRHSRKFDKSRSVLGIVALLVAILLEDLRYLDIFVGYMCVIVVLVLTKALRTQQVMEAMNWRSFLTIGLGLGISTALKNTGVAGFLADLLHRANRVGGVRAKLFSLSCLAQVAAYALSPTPAGMLMAPLAIAVSKDEEFGPEKLTLLVIMSCNMTLIMPNTPVVSQSKKRLTISELLCWGLPAQLIMTVAVVAWTMTVTLQETTTTTTTTPTTSMPSSAMYQGGDFAVAPAV